MKKVALLVMAATLLIGLPVHAATPYWVKGVEKAEENATAHLNRGIELFEMGQYAEAEKEFDMAMDEASKGNGHLADGIGYGANPWDLREAEKYFQDVTCAALLNRGTARYYQGKTPEALGDWEWVISLGKIKGGPRFPCIAEKNMAEEKLEYIKSTTQK